MIFLEIFSLGKFLWEAELVEPEALVADFWDQDGLVASLEVSGSEIEKVLPLILCGIKLSLCVFYHFNVMLSKTFFLI